MNKEQCNNLLKEKELIIRELVKELRSATSLIREVYGSYGINGEILYIEKFEETAKEMRSFLKRSEEWQKEVQSPGLEMEQ